MIYAMSDLHGCYDKYIRMLEKIQLGKDDTLYILGDVIDRGPHGVRILLDMLERENVIPLLGNHEHFACRLLKNPVPLTDAPDRTRDIYRLWFADGGASTYAAFTELPPDQQKRLLSYLDTFWIYEELEVDGRRFFLSHTVPEKDRMQHFQACLWQEFIAGEPEYEKEYFADKYLVTGHTPTGLIEEAYTGKIYRKNHHIAIDCGAVFGHPLGCICLDTLEEFYVE